MKLTAAEQRGIKPPTQSAKMIAPQGRGINPKTIKQSHRGSEYS